MKLTPQRAKELAQKGVKISPGQVVRETKKSVEAVKPTSVEPQLSDLQDSIRSIERLISITETSVQNTQDLIRLSETITRPKKWRCSVGRSGGSISTIDINEIR